MRRSTRTEEDWLLGQTSDTSSRDWLKGGNTENCNSMGGTLQRKWLGYFTLKSSIHGDRSRTLRPADDSEVGGGKPGSWYRERRRLERECSQLGISAPIGGLNYWDDCCHCLGKKTQRLRRDVLGVG